MSENTEKPIEREEKNVPKEKQNKDCGKNNKTQIKNLEKVLFCSYKIAFSIFFKFNFNQTFSFNLVCKAEK